MAAYQVVLYFDKQEDALLFTLAASSIMSAEGPLHSGDAGVKVAVEICNFFFTSRRRHTRLQGDWSSDVCSSDLSGADNSKCMLLSSGDMPGLMSHAIHIRCS